MLLKRKEAAALLGVEPKTLDTWVERAGLSYDRDRLDHRLRLLTQEQVEAIASEHGRTVKTSPMEQRINELESELARLRQRASWLFEDAPTTRGEAHQTHPPGQPARLHTASRTRPFSLTQLHGADALPAGWRAANRWAEEHGVQARSWWRDYVEHAGGGVHGAQDGVRRWRGTTGQGITAALDPEQQRAAAAFARVHWRVQFQPCDDGVCCPTSSTHDEAP